MHRGTGKLANEECEWKHSAKGIRIRYARPHRGRHVGLTKCAFSWKFAACLTKRLRELGPVEDVLSLLAV